MEFDCGGKENQGRPGMSALTKYSTPIQPSQALPAKCILDPQKFQYDTKKASAYYKFPETWRLPRGAANDDPPETSALTLLSHFGKLPMRRALKAIATL